MTPVAITAGAVASIGGGLAHALSLAFGMFWEILWALILGFALSGAVQAVVSKAEMTRLLPDDSPRSLAIACGLGAASSSCSYAAVALARSIFRKGANFTASMAFEFASTNLVIELGIILALLMGWQFTLAEFVGGPLMVVLLALLFRAFLTPRLVEMARRQAEKGLQGSMEGHAQMDMSVTEGPLRARLTSPEGFTATSHYFVMDWDAIWKDIAGGLLIAGALAAWVPNSFWQGFFLVHHPLLAKLWGPLVGPLVAIFSFVCSIGTGDVLRDHGRGRPPRGGRLRRPGTGARRPPPREGDRGARVAQLHDRPGRRIPAAGRCSARALPPHRGPGDAPDDEGPGGLVAPPSAGRPPAIGCICMGWRL